MKKAGSETISWRVFKFADGKEWPVLLPHQMKETTFGIKRVMLAKNADTGVMVVAKSLKFLCQKANLNPIKIKRKIQSLGYGAVIDGWIFFKEIDLANVDLDQISCIMLRGSDKDFRSFSVVDIITTEKFYVIGVRELVTLTKYEETYLRRHVNQLDEGSRTQVGHFEITLVGTQNPIC